MVLRRNPLMTKVFDQYRQQLSKYILTNKQLEEIFNIKDTTSTDSFYFILDKKKLPVNTKKDTDWQTFVSNLVLYKALTNTVVHFKLHGEQFYLIHAELLTMDDVNEKDPAAPHLAYKIKLTEYSLRDVNTDNHVNNVYYAPIITHQQLVFGRNLSTASIFYRTKMKEKYSYNSPLHPIPFNCKQKRCYNHELGYIREEKNPLIQIFIQYNPMIKRIKDKNYKLIPINWTELIQAATEKQLFRRKHKRSKRYDSTGYLIQTYNLDMNYLFIKLAEHIETNTFNKIIHDTTYMNNIQKEVPVIMQMGQTSDTSDCPLEDSLGDLKYTRESQQFKNIARDLVIDYFIKKPQTQRVIASRDYSIADIYTLAKWQNLITKKITDLPDLKDQPKKDEFQERYDKYIAEATAQNKRKRKGHFTKNPAFDKILENCPSNWVPVTHENTLREASYDKLASDDKRKLRNGTHLLFKAQEKNNPNKNSYPLHYFFIIKLIRGKDYRFNSIYAITPVEEHDVIYVSAQKELEKEIKATIRQINAL